MIARNAKIVQVRRLRFKGNVVSDSARVVADGLDEWLLLTSPAEVAFAERMLESGACVVLSLTEESSS